MTDENSKRILIPGDPQDLTAVDRRRLLQLGMASGSMMLLGTEARAEVAPKAGKKFIIYIHAGSWDGIAASMIQPATPNTWARGIFTPGEQADSINPNLNKHTKVGNLVLNPYSMPLETIANHVFVAVGNARSTVHGSGMYFQATGGDQAQPNAAWVVGAAQAFNGANPTSAVISTNKSELGKVNGETGSVVQANSASIASFRTTLSDGTGIERGDAHGPIWKVLQGLHKRRLNASQLDDVRANGVVDHIQKHVDGVPPELAVDSPLVADITTSISRTAVNALIDAKITDANDGVAVKEDVKGRFDQDVNYDSLLSRLQLAAAMAKLGLAKGMAIALEGQDYHSPNAEGKSSSVYTARATGQMYAQLAVFWQWIVAQNLQDDVMVVISHDFSRTPYQTGGERMTEVNQEIVVSDGAPVNIRAYQTDHQSVMGMVFINGKVPPAGRYGNIIDNYGVRGGKALDGVPDMGTQSATSMQIMGTMLMRCYPEQFPTEREVKRFWPNFPGPIPLLLG